MTIAKGVKVGSHDLDTIAWQFLKSEFTTKVYCDWPIDQRVDAFLHRHGLGALADDGTVYNVLLDRVMSNIARARSLGTLPPPRRGDPW
jgi:hypothetical protein